MTYTLNESVVLQQNAGSSPSSVAGTDLDIQLTEASIRIGVTYKLEIPRSLGYISKEGWIADLGQTIDLF